ncbi:MAG: L,D-transpeptidase family protein [Candidatus Berkiella sp.]
MMITVEQPTTTWNDEVHLLVDTAAQELMFKQNGKISKSYSISTAQNGVGEKKGSFQTPRGWHYIRAKIGQGLPINTIFTARRACGEFTPQLEETYPDKDWILSRILWLSGLEFGKNRLGDCDTMQRFIYIHGCPDSKPMGVALSHGCIRMRNQDIIALFDAIPIGMKVFIQG